MKKKALSLARALAMCLGLTIPAFAANPQTLNAGGIYFHISDVTSSDDSGAWYDSLYYTLAPDATITITEGQLDEDEKVQELEYEVSLSWTSFSFDAVGEQAGIDNSVLEFNKPYTCEELNRLIQEHSIAASQDELITDFRISVGFKNGFTDVGTIMFAKTTTDPEPTTPPAETIPASGTAKASTQAVEVDGKKVEFQMYALLDANGNSTNYVKLRDLAHVLNGTAAQFSVGYDGTISLTTGQPYEDTGSEMTTPFSGDRAYTGGGQSVKINGQAVELTAINLLDDNGGGYNYFKLRDLGAALGFNVSWSAERGIFVETDKPYAG